MTTSLCMDNLAITCTGIAMSSVLRLIILFCSVIPTFSHFEKAKDPPNLLVVGLDGFRWDYLTKTSTPNFDAFIAKGVRTKRGLKDAFITKTFPNFYTLATGLWAESHGVVGNNMYDPNFKETFSMPNPLNQYESKWFDNGGEPIWVTNQLQNSHHRSGVHIWPGGTAAVKGVLPVRSIVYNESAWPYLKIESRIDTVIDWFTSEYPINLGFLYYEEPDLTGHKHGPDSEEVKTMIGSIDKDVGYLLKKLKEKDLLEKTNIIITSDHGFSSTSPDKVINLDKYINPSAYRAFEINPVATLLPNEGELDQLYKNLTAAAKKEHFTVYKKEDIPARFHYKHNDRILPLLVVADDHYQLSNNNYTQKSLGQHGYDNSLQDMHPILLAMGPSFKAGASIDVMDSVDLYPLMCHLLGLHPAPNNGSLQSALPLLEDDDDDDAYTATTLGTYIGILILIASVGGVYMVAACRQHRYLKRKQNQMLPLSSLQGSLRYASPPNGAKIPLLTDTEDEELFD